MKQVYGKVGNMRKAVEWTVYPVSYNKSKTESAGARTLFVQSDKRALSINLDTNKGMLSNGKGHPSFMSVNKFMGGTEVDVPQDFIDQCLEKQPKTGDKIGTGFYFG